MPTISEKGRLMPESPIRKLVPFAEDAKKRGIDVIHLNIGQPDIKTPGQALAAVRNNTLEVLEYSRTEGTETYREKLAKYYLGRGIKIGAADIVVSTGGSEALAFALGSIADPGDEIIVPEPFYANYNGFATVNGIRVIPVASGFSSNFALPPISAFEERISRRTRAILICNPGNPTGYLYSEEEIRQLATLARKHDLFLIADEVYREFAYEGRPHFSVLQLEDMESHAIMVDSVSKRYSMCGARIGCLVSRNPELIRTVIKFAQARLSPPTFALIASEAALDTPQSYFDEVLEEYQSRRDLLVEGLNHIPGVQVAKPQGAFYCMAALPVEDADHFARWLLESFSFEGTTVMLAPAAGFYATPGLGTNEVRIAYVLNKERLNKAIRVLDAALKSYPGSCKS